MNVDGFIARRNIDRFYDTSKIDVEYLTTLSDDAIPAMVDLVDDLDEGSERGQVLYAHLGARLYALDAHRSALQNHVQPYEYAPWREYDGGTSSPGTP